MFVKILVFVKILSQWKRKEGRRISIVRSARGKVIALKNWKLGFLNGKFVNSDFFKLVNNKLFFPILSGIDLHDIGLIGTKGMDLSQPYIHICLSKHIIMEF